MGKNTGLVYGLAMMLLFAVALAAPHWRLQEAAEAVSARSTILPLPDEFELRSSTVHCNRIPEGAIDEGLAKTTCSGGNTPVFRVVKSTDNYCKGGNRRVDIYFGCPKRQMLALDDKLNADLTISDALAGILWYAAQIDSKLFPSYRRIVQSAAERGEVPTGDDLDEDTIAKLEAAGEALEEDPMMEAVAEGIASDVAAEMGVERKLRSVARSKTVDRAKEELRGIFYYVWKIRRDL